MDDMDEGFKINQPQNHPLIKHIKFSSFIKRIKRYI